MAFTKGEEVLYYQDLLLYKAKVIKTELKDDTLNVLVHRDEDKEGDGIWVPESKVLKCTEASLQKQKELLDKYSDEKKAVKRGRPFSTDSSDNSDTTKRQKNSKVLYYCVTKSSCSQTSLTTCEQGPNCRESDNGQNEERSKSITPSNPQEILHHSENYPLTEIKGVIFDMDGTLTLPVLDFKGIRESLGLSPGTDILTTVQQYTPEEKAKAMSIIEEYEEDGLRKLQLQPGVLDLLHYLAEREIKRAVMTRNSTKASKAFMEKLKGNLFTCQSLYPCLQGSSIFSQRVDPVGDKNDDFLSVQLDFIKNISSQRFAQMLYSHPQGNVKVITRDFEPCKPHPAPVLHICEQWELQPSEVIVIGDDKTDMISGLRAGTGVNILLRNERNSVQVDYSNFAVDTLTDICSLCDVPMAVCPKEPPTQ